MILIDHNIIKEIKQGNRKAMQQLYSLTARYLYAICQRYLCNEEDTKDVLQDTYVKIFRNIKAFYEQKDATLLSWMVRIAVNESLMFLRQKRRETFIESHSDIPDKEEELEVARFTAEELHNAIMLLPTGYRVVLNLYVFEKKKHKEIAQLLGIKEASSASQLNRAKHLLRKILLEQEGGKR